MNPLVEYLGNTPDQVRELPEKSAILISFLNAQPENSSLSFSSRDVRIKSTSFSMSGIIMFSGNWPFSVF